MLLMSVSSRGMTSRRRKIYTTSRYAVAEVRELAQRVLQAADAFPFDDRSASSEDLRVGVMVTSYIGSFATV